MSNVETRGNESNISRTENRALGYKTTGKELVDFNFQVGSMRKMSKRKIISKFERVYNEDRLLAIKWLFYARDIKNGMGERRLFRICLEWLGNKHPDMARMIYPLVPEFGRWDDLLVLLDTQLESEVAEYLARIVSDDEMSYERIGRMSLLSKWLPSENSSSKKAKRYAKKIVAGMYGGNCNESMKAYRHKLAKLRDLLDIVERRMSAKQFNQIDYAKVPSRANLIYSNAFLRNDRERRQFYLDALARGDVEIKADTLFPHDIVHRYMSYGLETWSKAIKKYDATLEQLWKALPNFVKDNGNTICVADGSGSMLRKIHGTNITLLSVANALAIYFSERCSGEFKNKYITFSRKPEIVDFGNARFLKQKLDIAHAYNQAESTNIEAVFKLILDTAIAANMSQEDMPDNILILSDMEFDKGINGRKDKKLFAEISESYQEAGYKLPRLVFWNIYSRTKTIPVIENELGVSLISGFSPAALRLALGDRLDPYESLVNELNSERYRIIGWSIRL